MRKPKTFIPFTPEQMKILSENPFTYKIKPRQIWFTLEFKNLFLTRYEAGECSIDIFESCGYSVELLGPNRIHGYPRRLRLELESGRLLTEGSGHEKKEKPKNIDYNTMPAQQSVASMQRELNYLRQQVEFLKKITELDNDKKQRT